MPKTDSIELNTVGWDKIDWRKVERYVYKLQKNIYTASRRGDVTRVRRLQKTLMRSWSNKVLAVRRVTQDNRGKKTAGVDGVKNLSPKARMKLTEQLNLSGKSKPTRRIWIPKPGKDEKRPLGIPTVYDRALQGVVKTALEPEWEAQFEATSYGFRPGRSCHDAIRHIKDAIKQKAKYVLDADIAKCFDRINHTMLLNKINHRGKVRRQIKSWLKAGVVDGGTFSKTSEGTPQGGVLSPLLANIALHGISKMLEDFIENTTIKDEKPPYRTYSKGRRIQSLTYIRYADDFVVIHKDIEVIQKCRELISKWLSDIGLELKPAKTRIAHTLIPEQSEDGKAGFNFLGYHIRQFPVSRHKSARNGHKQILGFYTLITPSKEAVKRHQRKLKDVIKNYKNSSQIKLINELNPVIRGWINYYQFSDATTVGEFCKQDHILHHKLRAWGRRRTGNLSQAYQKYWNTIGKRNWVFSFKDGDNLHQLISHTKYGSSSNNYVKVKNQESPYNGNLIYWSTRLGRNPDMPMRKAILLKKQKGICQWCSLHFQEEDNLETDHIIPKALNGKDTYDNLQLLHGHCHDEKTALDMKFIRNQRFQKYLEYINQELNKHQWFWDENDNLILLKSKANNAP